MTSVKETWVRAAVGISTACAAPQQGISNEAPKAQEINKTSADLRDMQDKAFWETEFTWCDSLVIAKRWGMTVNNSKSIIEDKVNAGAGYIVGTEIYQHLQDSPVDLSGLEYMEGHPVSYENKLTCTSYAEGLQHWYNGEERPFTYCDAELMAVYYDTKIREEKATLGNKASHGLVENARRYILDPARSSLQGEGMTGTSDFCQFDNPIQLP